MTTEPTTDNTDTMTAAWVQARDARTAAVAASEHARRLWHELEAAQSRAVVAWSVARNAARQIGDHENETESDKVARRHGDALDRLRVAFFKMAGRHLCARRT